MKWEDRPEEYHDLDPVYFPEVDPDSDGSIDPEEEHFQGLLELPRKFPGRKGVNPNYAPRLNLCYRCKAMMPPAKVYNQYCETCRQKTYLCKHLKVELNDLTDQALQSVLWEHLQEWPGGCSMCERLAPLAKLQLDIV